MAARVVELSPALVLEAMKMEHVVPLPPQMRVRAWHVAAGDMVEQGDLLAMLEPAHAAGPTPSTASQDDPRAIRADLQRVIDRLLAADGVVRASTVIALDTQISPRVLPLVRVAATLD